MPIFLFAVVCTVSNFALSSRILFDLVRVRVWVCCVRRFSGTALTRYAVCNFFSDGRKKTANQIICTKIKNISIILQPAGSFLLRLWRLFFSFEVLWNMQERPEYVICRYTYIQSIYSDFLAIELKNLVKSKNAMDKKSQSTIILSLTSIERGEGYWLFCQAAYSLCYIIISHFLASDNFHFKLWNIIRS